jgi:hypothetical protein
MSLRQAIGTIHADRQWWLKILISGALTLTLIGYPFAAGFEVESLDNTRKGFPTPLPIWSDWSTRYIIGLFAALIDFLYYVLPLFVVGMLFFCVGLASVLTHNAEIVTFYTRLSALVLAIVTIGSFLVSVSPVGRLVYVDDGAPEAAMSAKTLAEALRSGARGTYLRARLVSLPAYIPALVLFGLAILAAFSSLPLVWLIVLILTWLTLSALSWAHLVVLQIFAGAERELQERGTQRAVEV